MERCYNFPQFFVRIRNLLAVGSNGSSLALAAGIREIVGSCHNVPALLAVVTHRPQVMSVVVTISAITTEFR